MLFIYDTEPVPKFQDALQPILPILVGAGWSFSLRHECVRSRLNHTLSFYSDCDFYCFHCFLSLLSTEGQQAAHVYRQPVWASRFMQEIKDVWVASKLLSPALFLLLCAQCQHILWLQLSPLLRLSLSHVKAEDKVRVNTDEIARNIYMVLNGGSKKIASGFRERQRV